MKYKNIDGTGGRKCPSGFSSWLEYYMKSNGLTTTPTCSRKGCACNATLGAHVKKVGSTDNSWYIVPLCDACNGLSVDFEINSTVNPIHVR